MTEQLFNRVLKASLVCCLAVILTGCEELFNALDNPIQTTLVMTTTDVKLTVGDTYQRQATTVSPATIVYTSSDATVATVDANGVVEAIAEGEATITASVAEVDYWTAASTSYKVIVLAKTPATITTAPVATASIEPNSETALVTAGVADGGELMYAVTTTNTKPTTTEGFSAEIPTAATLAAGTYYVWYYAKGDPTHADSEIAAAAIEVKVGNSGLQAGKFSVSATKQVQFSQGNLQATYDGTKWTWAFAEHQWDYIGNTSCNQKETDTTPFVSENGTVDLFGWVGASSTFTGAAQYGITSSTTISNYSTVMGENLKVDWGATIGTGWRTLSKDEWTYLFSTRTTGGTVFGTASARYAHATINTDGTSVNGMILFPDGVDIAASEVTTAGTVNSGNSWGTKCTSAQWTALAAKGCVFLPAAGYRIGTMVIAAGSEGYYWSSSSFSSTASAAYRVNFYSYTDGLTYGIGIFLNRGLSVRLVCDVATE